MTASPCEAAACRWRLFVSADKDGYSPGRLRPARRAANTSSLQQPCPSPAPTGQRGLSKITEGTRLGEMNVFNKCQSAACFFSPVSSWSSVQRRYWKKNTNANPPPPHTSTKETLRLIMRDRETKKQWDREWTSVETYSLCGHLVWLTITFLLPDWVSQCKDCIVPSGRLISAWWMRM